MLDEVPAFAEYEAGNMDVDRVPLADMDRSRPIRCCRRNSNISPSLCTYYYGFNTKAPFVDDVRVRQALSMAVDRQSLIDNVTKGGQEPAQWFSRPGLAGCADDGRLSRIWASSTTRRPPRPCSMSTWPRRASPLPTSTSP